MGDLIFLKRAPTEPRPGLASADRLYREGCKLDEDPATLSRAEECYRKAVARDPRHVGALVNLGNIVLGRGCHNEAEGYYRTAVSVDVNHADAWYNLGFVRMMHSDNKTAALYFQMATALSPGCANAYYNCGQALSGCGENALAVWNFAQYIRLAPNDEWVDSARRCIARLSGEQP